MNITAIKTDRITAGSTTLTALLDTVLKEFETGSILVVTSKIVSLTENRVAPLEADKDQLIKQESQYYLDPRYSTHGYHFSVVGGQLTSSAGIDESNGNGAYVLWPSDAQKRANELRSYLKSRFKVQYAGVMIVDSTSLPLRRGAVGTCLAHSGFKALNDYRGKSDLFGRLIKIEVANISEGLAAASVVAMGEGAEGTPLAVLTDLSFVEFTDTDPTPEELAQLHVPLHDDYFGSFLNSAPWQRGDRP
jgi:F420-0:gamma-glutamyl ligase